MLPPRSHLLPLLLALAAPALSQRLGVGDPAPETLPLEDFSTGAADYEEYAGRAVLIEFFAHW